AQEDGEFLTTPRHRATPGAEGRMVLPLFRENGRAGALAACTSILRRGSGAVEQAIGRPASALTRPRITVRSLARVACRSCRSWSATVSRRTSVTPILIGWECSS